MLLFLSNVDNLIMNKLIIGIQIITLGVSICQTTYIQFERGALASRMILLVTNSTEHFVLMTFDSAFCTHLFSGKFRFKNASETIFNKKNCDKIPCNKHQIVHYVLGWTVSMQPCRLHRELFCFVKCFMVILNNLLR